MGLMNAVSPSEDDLRFAVLVFGADASNSLLRQVSPTILGPARLPLLRYLVGNVFVVGAKKQV